MNKKAAGASCAGGGTLTGIREETIEPVTASGDVARLGSARLVRPTVARKRQNPPGRRVLLFSGRAKPPS